MTGSFRFSELNILPAHLTQINQTSYYNRAIARHLKGDLDGAIADYTKAIELNPDYELAYLNRGRAKHDKSNLDGAIADCTIVLYIRA